MENLMKGKKVKRKGQQSGISRRDFGKVVAGIALVGACSPQALFAAADEVPAEPDDLDVPTPWQEGDPKPEEIKIPAVEPEQTSAEAPPSRPMEDKRPRQPAHDYAWVDGYWWWTRSTYMWVPGYWAIPPHANYTYISGFWTYKGHHWVYVRGGWAQPDAPVIVVYPRPRLILMAFVFTAPRRIIRRHHRWHHYHARRVIRRRRRHEPNRKPARPRRPNKR